MTSTVIKETPDYVLRTGINAEGRTCYQLINTVHDVIEAETQLLPQAFEYIEQLQAGLDALRDMEKERVEATKPRVVSDYSH